MRVSFASRLGLLLLLSCTAHIAASGNQRDTDYLSARDKPLTTYERFLPLAVAGDSEVQNFLGYMYFYGEGVELNYEAAHEWFHLAAEEGHARAQRDLGVFHARAIGRVPERFYDPGEANRWLSLYAANPENIHASPVAAESYYRYLNLDLKKTLRLKNQVESGRRIYLASCAGCHGFDGNPAYPEIPSFARGENLDQSDVALGDAIVRTHGNLLSIKNRDREESAQRLVKFLRNRFSAVSNDADPVIDRGNNLLPDQARGGEETYVRFCGGCHGFNGIAWYVNSPSFALRERLHKSDEELIHSIKNGRGAMPSWEYMLEPNQINALVKFVRTLADSYEQGIVGELRRPGHFLRFRPSGETGTNWTADDFRQAPVE